MRSNIIKRLVVLLAFEIGLTAASFAGMTVDDIFRDTQKHFSVSPAEINRNFLSCLKAGDTIKCRVFVESVIKLTPGPNIDSLTLSESYFYTGYYYLLKNSYSNAARWFKLSSGIRNKLNCKDEIYLKCLYDQGVACFKLGDFKSIEEVMLRYINTVKKLHGKSAPELFIGINSLVAAFTELHEYSKAISYGDTALTLIRERPEINFAGTASLYENIGVCYTKLSDFSKAALYLEKAEAIFDTTSEISGVSHINLLNNLASAYYFLGEKEKAEEYFQKGYKLARLTVSGPCSNFLNSYAIILGNSGQTEKGEIILRSLLERVKKHNGFYSRDYIENLKNYAEYLRVFRIDLKKSLKLYEECNEYVNRHKEDIELKGPVLLGYALTLSTNGDQDKALDVIQRLLFDAVPHPATENPALTSVKPGRWSISAFRAKYDILWDVYKSTGDFKYLKTASATSELIINLLEKERINISEEESRIILGERYRDSYLFAIRDFEMCYRKTGNQSFLNKAFEYAEKSKVAGLLASTRELKATQFHIPADIAELEKKMRSDISYYDEKITEESFKEKPDKVLVTVWKSMQLDATRKRDSLIRIFEKKYPEYYMIKYNSRVLKPEDIPSYAGRNANYINYVVTDTMIYAFVANRKFTKLEAIHIDSSFFRNVKEFRNQLAAPSLSENARSGYDSYQKLGYYIYKTIFEPVNKYLISDKVLISPDNILSYIPFEALPVSVNTSGPMLYKNLPYLMNEFKISYLYSATFLAESFKHNYSVSNSVIAFAPVYTGSISLDSLLLTRQTNSLRLRDLPFARTEAKYVADITGGKLYLNDQATESAFKLQAGNYDIIHLAMHTALNDKYPMHSKMIFSHDTNSVEDGYLNTYEVYGMPLKAKMVVLSSCNTGMGQLHSGEGILSLARGFIYSGSQSVILSLWEVEDHSDAEIVKSFYKELKKGETKSEALRKARLKFLKNSDMLDSHPYFWSALAIYGNDAPVYYSRQFLFRNVAILLLICLALFYSYRRLR